MRANTLNEPHRLGQGHVYWYQFYLASENDMSCATLVVVARMLCIILTITVFVTPSSTVIKSNFYLMSSKGYLIHTRNADESQNNYAECKKLVKNKPKKGPHCIILFM